MGKVGAAVDFVAKLRRPDNIKMYKNASFDIKSHAVQEL